MAFSLRNIVIKPDLLTLLYRDRPLCTPMPLDSGTPKYTCGLMFPWGTRKWTSAIGTRQSNMAFSLPNVVIKPDLLTLFHGDQTRSFNAISRRSPPLCSLALRLRNTKVSVWTHESIEYPKMDISHWDAAIHYGVQLAQYCDQTRSFNAISRRSPPVYSLVLTLRNTKVPVLTHESIGYPKMDISHWDAAIHYGVQLAQYCDQTRSLNAISRRPPPCALPCPKTQEHWCTCVDSWDHRVPENGHHPLGRGNSLWRSACPILWSNPILQRYFTGIAPLVLPCPKTREQQSTCVDSWVHRVPENGHQPLGRGNSLWRSACLILWSNPILQRYFTEITPLFSLALGLRNTKVPVLTHESIGYPKMDISHWDAAIHFGDQLAQYYDQTPYFNANLQRSPPVYSLALRLRNTKVFVWTHESIEYPKMDISHWDAAIHYGVQLAQYCDQTLSCNAISPRSPPCAPLP